MDGIRDILCMHSIYYDTICYFCELRLSQLGRKGWEVNGRLNLFYFGIQNHGNTRARTVVRLHQQPFCKQAKKKARVTQWLA